MSKQKNKKQSSVKGNSIKEKQQPAVKKQAVKPVAADSLRKYYPALLAIVVVSFIAYLPAIQNGFVWDDEFYIQSDSLIHSVNLKQLFSQYVMGNYHPLTMLSYAIEYHFWGLGEKGYHLVNIFIHLANTVLVFYAIMLLSKKPEVALVAALLFGIHPMHVESVAWVAERKDLLYTFFFLASYIYYLKYLQDKKMKFYFICLLLFLLSMLSKAMAASLPVVLILTDYFKEGKISVKRWLEKLPFIGIAGVLGVVAVFAQQSHHAVADIAQYTLLPRIVFASAGFMTYLFKLFLPINLSAYYPYPVKGGQVVPVLYYIYPVLLLGLIAFIIYSLRYGKKIFFGIGFFAITVFLVLQLLPVGDAMLADRYSYIPSIGIFYLIGEGFYLLWNKKGSKGNLRIPAITTLVVISGLLSFATYERCIVWKNGINLWNDVISKFQNIPSAYNNRGKLLLEQKNYDAALSDFNKALELDPNYPQALNNRGALLTDQKRYAEAEKDFTLSLAQEVQPNAYNNRGRLRMMMNRFDESLADYTKAIELKPDLIEAYFNRGILYQNNKKYEEALGDYTKALELNPNYYEVYSNRANVLMELKRYDEALSDYNKDIQVNPNPFNAYLNRGTLFLNEKKYDEAISDYGKAIALDPNSGIAYYNRGYAENSAGKKNEACQDFQHSISVGYAPAKDGFDYYCH